MNDTCDLALCPTNNSGFGATTAIIGTMDCLPIMNGSSSSSSSGIGTLGIGAAHHHIMPNGSSSSTAAIGGGSAPTVTVVGSYQQHLANLHAHHPHLNLVGHHTVTPYSNNYPLHHSSSHHHIQSEQTKSLQELQHEVGALLEFRDLVIETFPDLKHKMASMSSSSAASTTIATGGALISGTSVSGANTLIHGNSSSGMPNASLVSRREWEPGIRLKRKISQKEPSTHLANAATAANTAGSVAGVVAGELSSSSLTRSRSNSHSGKKEPKSGENNNGSVVQDSGFSTETSSSKEGHSASSTNGAMTGPTAMNRLSCHESDDELLNLLDVIHRKSNRLREEMDQLQQYERQNLRGGGSNNNNNLADESTTTVVAASETSSPVARSSSVLAKSSSGGSSNHSTVNGAGLTPKTFREHVERLNKEDIKQLRKERDRLLDKLAEMEAETLTGRIKAAKMNDQVEELISVKKDLEEQLKLAMAQRLDLSARVQQLQIQQQQQQQQQQQLQSKSSSSQSDYSSQRNFLSSATTVLSTGSAASVQLLEAGAAATTNTSILSTAQSRRQHTFQPVVVVDQHQLYQRPSHATPPEDVHIAFHQSAGSDSKRQQSEQSEQQQEHLGRLDGIVSTPGGRYSKCRMVDSKRFAAILLETSVVELQRHLLTLTVQNQVLMQKLDAATKSKTHLAKRLDKSKDDVEDLRFQLEEKNIELEGTKAQLRVLESRIHSVTPSSGAPTNSYLHSQNDYETNRSSASTTLMLSRRGIGSGASDTLQYSDLRSATPVSTTTTTMAITGQMPAPQVTQISTPSMKAMVHLPMDELQQHSSSTESAHDHDELQEIGNAHAMVSRLMSASVGGVSPFENALRGKKVSIGSKPSKIPLPGSKAAAYFAGKPPSGRPSTAGRSPPSTHTYAASNSSSKSSLCRSTGNLLYSKSPNSLKRADSAQSIRKDNSSLSTNTSRSSTSSSIPLATHHLSNATSKSPIGAAAATPIPSPRVLQNSPLPKLKRESLTSRVRHLDSLSRVHQHNHHSNISNGGGSDVSCTSPTATSHTNNNNTNSTILTSSSPTALSASSANSYIVSSTPKPSAIAAHLNATLRKDMQLNTSSYGAQQFLRRATGGNASANSSAISGQSGVNSSVTARRFSSASAMGARIASRNQSQDAGNGEHQQQHQQQSDSDSGKHSLLYELLPNFKNHNKATSTITPVTSWRQQQWQQVLTQALNSHAFIGDGRGDVDCGVDVGGSALSPTTFAARPLPQQLVEPLQLKSKSKDNYNFVRAYELEEKTKLQEQHVNKMNSLPEASISSYDYYYSNESFRSSDRGSDNILVTFDYGFSDSLLEEISGDDFSDEKKKTHIAFADLRTVYPIKEETEYARANDEVNVWQRKPLSVSCLEKYEGDDYSDSWEQKDEDEQEEAVGAQIWFNTALTRSKYELGCGAAFKVHHMQHALAEDGDEEDVDEQSNNSSLVEQNIVCESGRSASSASSFYYRRLALDQWGEEVVVDDADIAQKVNANKGADTEDEGEEFFDSLN
ncbi:uncharacterized protein LOC128871960 [Anastrepha ludens]|uniref:uncharacterized protein LOC128871960 n=1 Tax=Anastrepha ludens TaxID=28586 RepID=UPI0023AF4F73|nr:uncharacterized protein LOC128871960 [Anastrepha ludens]